MGQPLEGDEERRLTLRQLLGYLAPRVESRCGVPQVGQVDDTLNVVPDSVHEPSRSSHE